VFCWPGLISSARCSYSPIFSWVHSPGGIPVPRLGGASAHTRARVSAFTPYVCKAQTFSSFKTLFVTLYGFWGVGFVTFSLPSVITLLILLTSKLFQVIFKDATLLCLTLLSKLCRLLLGFFCQKVEYFRLKRQMTFFCSSWHLQSFYSFHCSF